MEHAPSPGLPLVQDVQRLLRTRQFGRALRGYERVGSTSTLALEWAGEGAPEGSVVVAEYQSAGRGRMGRSWQARAGQNLTLSLILRPKLPPARLSLLSVAAGLAVAEAVEAFAQPLTVRVKWPNDVLLEGRKCCGLLLESVSTGLVPGIVVLGIGLNVNQDRFPDAYADRATSLLLETGRHVARAPLLAELLLRLERRYDSLFEDEGQAVRRAYETRLAGVGQPTILHFPASGETVSGICVGITETGALRLQTNAETRTFHAGEVTSHVGF